MDYAAMLSLPLRLFDRSPEALRLHQDAYRYVLGDEGQDVCPAQQALLLLLASRHHNLSVVGDTSQAVFAWRGADTGFLARFAQDVPGATVLTLDECFRCSGRILAVANALGAPLDYHRPIRTANDAGPPPRLCAAADPPAEATFIAQEIDRLRRHGEVTDLGDVGVLYRTNGQAHELQLALRSRGLPYRTHGPDLFTRGEVGDVVAYLRLGINPDDAAALARVVDRPPRGLRRLALQLRHTPVPLSDLPAAVDAAGAAGSVETAQIEALAQLVRKVHQLFARAPNGPGILPAAAVDVVLEHTGYRAWLRGQTDEAARLAAIDALRAFAERAACGLVDWPAALALADTDASAATDGDPTTSGSLAGGRVALTTIHGAKGREWDAVFVAGFEEGLLPHAKALAAAGETGREALQEERRLAYVAVTRAQRFLYFSYCHARPRGDRLEARRPSRFLDGLPVSPLQPRQPGEPIPTTASAPPAEPDGEARAA